MIKYTLTEALPDSIYRHNSQNSRCCASFSVGIDVWRVGGACNALLTFGRVGKVEELIFFLRDSGGRLSRRALQASENRPREFNKNRVDLVS